MKLLATVAVAASAQYNGPPTTASPPVEETTVAPTCQDGYTFNNDGVCVQENPCDHPHTCAYHADCVPSVENTWDFTCVCDKYGDGVNICKDPAGCEPGSTDGECACSASYAGPEWANITASWNDTDTCYYEIQVAAGAAEVGTWQLTANFDQDVTLLAVWNTVFDPVSSSTSSLVFRPQFWNQNSQGGFNFHITTTNYDSGCPLQNAPETVICNSPFYPDADEATPIDELQTNQEGCQDLDVTQYNVWEAGSSYKQTFQMTADLDKSIKEWYIAIAVNDTASFNSIITYNTQFDAVNNVLTAEDYARTLYAGTNVWSGELDLAVENVALSAQICFQRYE